MRRRILIFVILFIIAGVILGALIDPSFFIEHYNGISFYHIATRLTKDKMDTLSKMQALIEYLKENVFTGHFETQDLPPLENLIRGIGWCDQSAHLYLRLIEPLDIRGYLFFLRNSAGASPHSAAVVTPKTKRRLENYAEIIKEGWIVDTQQGVLFKNKLGQPATFSDICSKDVLKEQDKYFSKKFNPHSLYCNEANVFLSNTPISLDNKKRRVFYKYIFPFLPEKAINLYQDILLERYYKKIYTGEAFLYFKARNYHIYERFDEAEKLYELIINSTKDEEMAEKCLFFQGMLYFRMNRFSKTKEKFKTIIEKYPASPWSLLAQDWQSEADEHNEGL